MKPFEDSIQSGDLDPEGLVYLMAMEKKLSSEILINVRPQETRVAYVTGGTLIDFKIERKTSPTLVGSIHRGRVLRVLPGMQAAFVDIGMERAAFLYVGDIREDIDADLNSLLEEEDEGEKEPLMMASEQPLKQVPEDRPPIQDIIKEGQSILVQVAKDPLGTKGARITTHLSLPGRCVVYMPTVRHLGISRRIEDEAERERLKDLVQRISPQGGVIIRTAGEQATEDMLRADIDYLDRLSKEIFRAYDKMTKPGLIHAEMDVELRALRDLLSADVTRVMIDNLEAHKKVKSFVTQFMPHFKSEISYYNKKIPLFDLYDIELELSRSLDRKIWLKSGGYIVIDEAEALVVIDVNTGRFVGKKDLEDTILKTNMEAVKEIAHQLMIRNVGGIIIIDFIDMEKEIHRQKILDQLGEELERDRARTNIVSMSELGLVEMTRKRIRPSLIRMLCEECPYCDGKGYIKTKSTVANELFRELEREAAILRRPLSSAVVHCHTEVVDWIYEMEGENLEFIEERLGCSVAFKIEPDYHIEQHQIDLIIK